MLTRPLAKAKPPPLRRLTHLSAVKRSSQNLLGATPLSKYSCGLISNYISYGPVVHTVVYTVFRTGLKTMGEDLYAHAEIRHRGLGLTLKIPTSLSTCNCFFFWGGGAAGLWRQPFLWQRAWCHFHTVWGKKEFMAAPSMPTSAIKLSTGSEAIFWAWRSLPLLALSLFNIMLPALVGNPQRVVPVSLHAATHNETKPGT